MDERYFQNRPKNTGRSPAPDRSGNGGYRKSTPDLDATQAIRREPFVVHLPEEEQNAASMNRTPRGQRLTDSDAAGFGAPPYTPAKPQSSPVQNRSAIPQQSRPATPQRRSVAPQGRPISPQNRAAAPQNRPVPAQNRPVSPQYRPVSPQNRVHGQNDMNRPSQRPIAKDPNRAQANARPVAAIPPARQHRSGSQGRSPVPGRKRKKTRSKKKTAALVILCIFGVLITLIAGGLIYGYVTIGRLNYDTSFNDSNAYMDESTLMSSKSVKNILFIGSDERDYDAGITGGRSDTVILCSVDSRHHKVKLTSFLRDAYVYIPSKDQRTRLNAAFSYGGPQLLVDTIEYNFKVKIDGYILIDFEGFAKMIDLMGGLDVEGVTAAEAKYLRETVKILYAKEGTNHFSGKASLWYCRIRKLDSDFQRTERQRKVIGAIAKQAMHTNPVKLMKIIKEAMPMFTTSLKRTQVLPTAILALFDYLGGDNPQHQVPADGTWKNATIGGAAVLQFDEEENVRLLKEFIYD